FQNNKEQYPSLIQSYYDLHTKKGVWRDGGSNELYVAGVGTSTMFGSQVEGTPFYSQREMNETQGMSQLSTMFPGSTTEVGSTSGTASASRDASPSGNVDPSSSGSLDRDDEDVRDL
ncbi:hypothetical protein Tco_0110768, partial [Tanacetum coccineum]